MLGVLRPLGRWLPGRHGAVRDLQREAPAAAEDRRALRRLEPMCFNCSQLLHLVPLPPTLAALRDLIRASAVR
jgi:hypothetical protein